MVVDSQLGDALSRPEPVAVLFGQEITALWPRVIEWGEDFDDGDRLIACQWELPPSTERLLDDVLGVLANAALADWPCWYGRRLAQADTGLDQRLAVQLSITDLQRDRLRILPHWLKQAADLCLRGQSPIQPDLTCETQVGQLSLALAPNRLAIALSTAAEFTSTIASHHVAATALATAAEWLHRVTAARVRLVLPITWQQSPAIARFPSATTMQAAATPALVDATTASLRAHISPQAGRPHPGSESEQLLFRHITADPVLAEVLAFNQTVRVALERTYRVDILCASHRLVFEIDGRDHRQAAKYIADCERDFQLLLKGYRVIRLPEELVLEDVEQAMARIRLALEVAGNGGLR